MANKVIISGGGTGGHVFPAIAIANALRSIQPDIEILFVGANGKMEMEKVPDAGYDIFGLDIRGFNRESLAKNITLPFKVVGSMLKSKKILKDFKPDVVVGVGGYASGPILMMANFLGIPTLIQEQNSFPGKTNISLAKQAKKICVAYDGLQKYFPEDKIILTGNPIRRSSVLIEGKREQAIEMFDIDASHPTILVTGGSLGAKTLNDCVKANIQKFVDAEVQVIWQCGGNYFEPLADELVDTLPENIKLTPFLTHIDYAYSIADVVIARAGACTISELCAVGKPTILVPSPNVAEDHQSKNALALVNKNATILVKDSEAKDTLVDTVLSLLHDDNRRLTLGENIKSLAKEDADETIAWEILKLISK